MQKEFKTKDSSISFILALVIPNVLAFFILLIAGIIVGDITSLENTIFYKIMATLLSQAVFLSIYFYITKRKNIPLLKSYEKDKLNYKQIIILVLIALVCLFLISPIINVFDAILVELGFSTSTLPISLNKPINFIYLILTLGVLAPLSEELLFRGIIFSGLKEKGNKTAILISNLMFMLVHLSIHQTVYQFILGIILALVVLYTNNIFSSILIHFINNTFVLIINYINPYFFDYKFLSSGYIILALVLFFVAIITLYELLKMLKKQKKNNDKKPAIKCDRLVESKTETNDYLKLSLVFGVILWIITFIMTI